MFALTGGTIVLAITPVILYRLPSQLHQIHLQVFEAVALTFYEMLC